MALHPPLSGRIRHRDRPPRGPRRASSPSVLPWLRVGASLLCAVAVAGCTSLVPPQPWQKGALARPEMTMQADVLEQRHGLHVYTSRESAAGGYGVGGGGCGCN